MRDALISALRFTGRVPFTMVLLLIGIVVMITGTVIESRQGAEAAREAVYGTLAFDLWLVLIALNLVIAVVNRLPLRRSQWPFALTHAAIVLLLAGALWSRTGGREGLVTIAENQSVRTMELDTSELRVQWGAGSEEIVALGKTPRVGRIRLATPGAPSLRIAEVVQDAELRTELGPGEAKDGPGVALRFRSPSLEQNEWLLGESPFFRRKDIGPVEVEFLVARDETTLQQWLPARSSAVAQVTVVARGSGQSVQADLPAELDVEKTCGDVSVVARQYLARARLVGQQLADDPEAPVNPAAVLTVRRGDQIETHTVFSQMPQFNVVKGRDGEGLVGSITLAANGVTTKPLVRILGATDGRHWVQLQAATERGEGWPLTQGKSVVLGNLGLDVELLTALPHATAQASLQPARRRGSGAKWIHIASSSGEQASAGWIQYGAHHSLRSEDGQIALTYRPHPFELPFSIQLRSFDVAYHQGTGRAAQYSSHVVLQGADGVPMPATVAMNQPVDFLGYRIFQSSFVPGEPGRPDTTVLSLSMDPGVNVVYVAMILLVIGVTWYLRSHAPLRLGAVEPAAPEPRSERASAVLSGTAPEPARTAVFALALLAMPAAALALAPQAPPVAVGATRGWAVQADGRLKPLETWADETIVAVTGKHAIDGYTALDFVWGLHFAGDELRQRPWVRIDSQVLKQSLRLAVEQRRFSFAEILDNPIFQQHVESTRQRSREGTEPLRVARDALEVYGKLEAIAGIMDGSALRLLPTSRSDGAWGSLADLRADGSAAAQRMFAELQAMAAAYRAKDAAAFAKCAGAFERLVRDASGTAYPAPEAIRRELFYHDLNAFGRAWMFYLASMVPLLLLQRLSRRWLTWTGFGLLGVGFALHTTGILLRWLIAGRAPVSDMYESLVFMSWGTVMIGFLLELRYGGRFFALSAAIMGFISLLLAEALPLDSAINPLVPVLAHTAWLSVHVMTIILSYSAFGLSMALGHVVLVVQLLRPGRTQALAYLSSLLYRTIQVGLVFLTAGIVFGAMWANESWGRYWGWDPKETWSLITFFVYLAIVHARFAGWLSQFGLALLSILGFLSVLMTYYGVNFVLASGLHSYGFSSGGLAGIGAYLVAEAIVVAWAMLRYRSASLRATASRLPAA